MLKILKKILISLIILIIIVLGFISFTLFTTQGAEFGLVIAKLFMPKGINIKYNNISGSLYRGLNFKGITIYKSIEKNKTKLIRLNDSEINLNYAKGFISGKLLSKNIIDFNNKLSLNNLRVQFDYSFETKTTSLVAKTNEAKNSDNISKEFHNLFVDINIRLNKSDTKPIVSINNFNIFDDRNNFIKINNINSFSYNLKSKLNIYSNKELIKIDVESELHTPSEKSFMEQIILKLKRLDISTSKDNLVKLKNNKNKALNQIEYSNSQIKIESTCIIVFDNQACIKGNIDLNKNLVALKGDAKDINFFEIIKKFDLEQYNKANFNAKNNFEFNINYDLNKNLFSKSNIALYIEPGFLTTPNSNKKYYFNKGFIKADIIHDKLSAIVNFDLLNNDFIKANIELNNIFNIKKLTIDGKLNSIITDLTPVGAILPDSVNNIQGKLNCNYKIKGKADKISGKGSCNLNKASFVISNLNIKVTNLNLASTINNNKLNFNGSLESENDVRKNLGITGNGKLVISGSTDLQDNFNTNINIKGSNFLGENTISGIIYLSPDINIKISPDGMGINGQVNIPQARIYGSKGTSSLERKDVIFVGKGSDQKKQQDKLFKVNGQLKLIIDEKVKFEMSNFSTNIIGNLTFNFKDYIDAPLVTGVLELKNGVYSMYDQELRVTKGVLNYINNSIDNPIASIQAEKTINMSGYSSTFNRAYVGISVTGPLGSPRLNLISNPYMPKDDILSYLIFGTPSSDTGGAQMAILVKALQGVIGSTSESGSFLGSIFSIFKFDEIKMESININDPMGIPTQSNQVLVLGKKITDKLFVRYGFSLLDPLGLFQAKYQFGENWGFETSYNSFDELRANLIYFKESN